MEVAPSPKLEIVVAQKQEQNEKKPLYKGSIRLQNGHKMWEVDLSTWKIEEAKIDNTEVMSIYGKQRKKLLMREGYTYVPALNKDNAAKKVLKRFGVKFKQN